MADKAMLKSIDTVLFDWDGTLADTAQESFLAFQKSMTDIGISMSAEVYAEVYSPNWRHMLAALRVPEERWKEVETLWTRHYGVNHPKLMPGARETLQHLAARGFRMGVVSSGYGDRVRYEIGSCRMEKLFQVVICGEDVRQQKPHPEGLELAMQQLGRTPEACCYVGDTFMDIEMGQRASVRTIGIPGRYPGSDKLLGRQPDYVLESIGQLQKMATD